MDKELSDMTLSELWKLFPIVLREYNKEYKEWYEIEKNNLLNNFEKNIKRISHIGSTAVEGLISKPTVDILMEISEECDINVLKKKLSSMGFILMKEDEKPYFSLVYNKGYTKHGFSKKVFHLHIRFLGNWDELYFRDYLIENKDIAIKYSDLKLSLCNKYKNNRDKYTEEKTEFVKYYSSLAKIKYLCRYKV